MLHGTNRGAGCLGVVLGVVGVGVFGCVERNGAEGETSGGGSSGSESTGVVPTSGSGGSTTGVGETSGVGEGSSGESGHDFVHRFDQSPPTSECSTFEQNCAEGEKCVVYAERGGAVWSATKCVMVTGDQQVGEPCLVEGGGTSGVDDCAKGAMCWDVDKQGAGTCVALCGGTQVDPVCDSMHLCLQYGEYFGLCELMKCDPLVLDCAGGDLCIPYGDGFVCRPDLSGEMGAVNDPCDHADACDAGLVCITTAEASSACMQGPAGCCQPVCEFVMGQDGDCPNADQKCVQWFDPNMPIPDGLADVGVCRIPA